MICLRCSKAIFYSQQEAGEFCLCSDPKIDPNWEIKQRLDRIEKTLKNLKIFLDLE